MNRPLHKFAGIFGVGLSALLLLTWSPIANPGSSYFDLSWSEEDFHSELVECTTGVASGAATPDGRPLLWKNRDVGTRSQEFHYYDDGRIPFISICYESAHQTKKYYGGVNAAGFAVENSNSYSFGGGVGNDDGWIHREALATCRTVDDFEAMIDSIQQIQNISQQSNYGAIDAFGGAAMFETAARDYFRHDCDDQPGGFIVRANFSYSDWRSQPNSSWGFNRHNRAFDKFKRGVENDELTPLYLFQEVIRDLRLPDLDPYPLPYDGYYENEPYGHLPNQEVVCRATTRGILVVQGVEANDDPDKTILWASPGNQIGSIFMPLWVRAGSVPKEMDGEFGSNICQMAIEIERDWVKAKGSVDTWKLTNPNGTGIWDYTLPIENWVYEKTMAFVNSPAFDFDHVEAFQNQIASQVADKLAAFKPAVNVTEISQPIFVDNNLQFAWQEIEEDDFERASRPRGYAIYRSNQPFRDGERGEQIDFVTQTRYVDADPPAGAAFYRVEAIF